MTFPFAPIAIAEMPAGPLVPAGRAKRVLILGAGMAGLSAALRLHEAGHDVTVLEARDRPGGRVETLRNFPNGLHAEAGAVFIGAAHHLVMGYCKYFRLSLTPLPNDGSGMAVWYCNGQRVSDASAPAAGWPVTLSPAEQAAMDGGAGIMGLWARYLYPALIEVRQYVPFLAIPPALAKYDQVTFLEFLQQAGASPGAIQLLRLGYFDLWGEGIESTSALLLLRDLAVNVLPPHMKLAPPPPAPAATPPPSAAESTGPAGGPPQAYTITDGNDGLPLAFAERLPGKIRYRMPVVRIEPGVDRVTVVCRGSGGPERFEADAVICALPFATLRDVVIDPPFSTAKRNVIAKLPMTSVCRVYVPTERKTWTLPGNGPGAPAILIDSGSTDLPTMWLHDPTIAQTAPGGILESYTAGQRARDMAARTEAERQALARTQLELVFPGIGAPLAGGTTKSWDADPWARGGYCWFRPGEMQAMIPAIAAPDGRVFFAGDHTSPSPAWMEGAIESGLRAAAEVHALR